MLALCSLCALSMAPVQVDALSSDFFDAPRLYPGIAPGGVVAVGDLDGDGALDLVSRRVGSPAQSYLSWSSLHSWTQQGARQIQAASSQSITAYAGGWEFLGEFGSHIADFTGDGFADFATTFTQYDAPLLVEESPKVGVRIYPGAGDGTLGAPLDYVLPGALELGGWTVADVDQDGTWEVALLARANSDWFLGWGELTSDAVQVAQPKALGAGFQQLHAGDFDGDGIDDLVVVRDAGDLLQLYRTAPSGPGGAASLALSASLPVPTSDLLHILPVLVVADWNSDGQSDVLVLRTDGELNIETLVFTGNGSSLDATPTTQMMGEEILFLAYEAWAVDWDADGDQDLLVNDYYVRMFEGQGDGTFQAGETQLGKTPFNVSGKITFQGVAGPSDFDGDGHADCVAWDTVFYGNGRFGADANFGAEFEGPSLVASWVEDVDEDGDLDLIQRTPGGWELEPSPLSFYPGDGSGAFEEPAYGFGEDPQTGLPYETLLGRADFDGDGRIEWLLEDRAADPLGNPLQGQLVLLEHVGNGNFMESGPGGPPKLVIESPPKPWIDPYWPAGDVDGDGDLDLFVEDGVHVNVDGQGLLFGKVPTATGTPSRVVDWDGDGDGDVLGLEGVDLVLRRNLGGFQFSTELLTALPDGFAEYTELDWDSDGDLDWAVSANAGGFLQILQNDAGVFSLGPKWTSPELDTSLEGGRDVAMGDVDGDGDLELMTALVYQRYNGGNSEEVVAELEWVAPGELGLARAWVLPNATMIDDLDGDGDLDVHRSKFWWGNGFNGAAGGAIRQYGSGSPGSGGIVPVLGVEGPYNKDSATLTKRLRFGVGGGLALYAVSKAEAELPGFPTASITTHVDPGQLVLLAPIPLDGDAGVPGDGGFDYPVQVQPFLTGQSFWEQVFVIDPGAPDLIAASNAVFVQLGN